MKQSPPAKHVKFEKRTTNKRKNPAAAAAVVQAPAVVPSGSRSEPEVKKYRREKQFNPKNKGEGEKSGEKRTEEKEEDAKKEDFKGLIWNDRNCDHDLDDHAASNVHTRKIKISSNLILACKMISHLENKHLTQDYAALVFSRKTNKEKSFDFMIDLRVTERLIRGLQIIIDENPVFFNKRTSSH